MTRNQNMSDIRAVLTRAVALQQQGKLDQAEDLHRQILARHPGHPASLQFLAARANQAGDFDEAAILMRRYLVARPDDPVALEALAHIHEQTGAFNEAVLCLGRALRVNSRDPGTLLLLGAALERAGEIMPAAAAASILRASAPELLELDARPDATQVYKSASIKVRNAMSRHHQVVLDDAVAAMCARFKDCDPGRFGRSYWRPHASQMTGDDRRPDLYYIPDIPQRPWLEGTDPAVASWVRTLQSKADILADEVRTVLDIQKDTRPYIADHMKGRGQWEDLAGRTNWGALHFYNNGKRDDAALARFPLIAAALETLPLMRLNGQPVEAFLSVLHPKTKIPAHYGVANHRLTVHLPLIVPENCGLSVNGTDRQTVAGSVMIFDDSFEHHAWNDSDDIRVVLIFEIWVPELTKAEHFAITQLLEEHEAFEAGRTALLSMPLMAPKQIIAGAREQIAQKPSDPLSWLDMAYGLVRLDRPNDAAAIVSLAEEHVPQTRRLYHDHRLAPHLRVLSKKADDVYCAVLDTLYDKAMAGRPSDRIQNAIRIETHKGPVPWQAPDQKPRILYVPALKTQPVYSLSDFSWLPELQAHAALMTHEILQKTESESIQSPDAQTIIRLFEKGRPHQGARARFPDTVAAIEALFASRPHAPMDVCFSLLKPQSQTPQHYGATNALITVHLPLVIPQTCSIKVGGHHHDRREGEAFAFDASFGHEDRNDSDSVRITLVLTVWHPELQTDEISILQKLFCTRADWMEKRTIPEG